MFFIIIIYLIENGILWVFLFEPLKFYYSFKTRSYIFDLTLKAPEINGTEFTKNCIQIYVKCFVIQIFTVYECTLLSMHFEDEIDLCHGLLKNIHVPAEDRTGDPSICSRTLFHVAIKAGLHRKVVQVYAIPNLYPVTFSPSILNSSSNSKNYKNHWK